MTAQSAPPTPIIYTDGFVGIRNPSPDQATIGYVVIEIDLNRFRVVLVEIDGNINYDDLTEMEMNDLIPKLAARGYNCLFRGHLSDLEVVPN